MCVIAYVPKNIKLSEKTIKEMFYHNPDGAGIMYQKSPKDKVEMRKGFFKVEELIKAFNEIPVTYERAIHCRIATSGKIQTATCHPFPLRSTCKEMIKGKDSSFCCVMHNGVISYATPKEGMKSKYSDTMNFVAKYLYPLRNQIQVEAFQNLLEHSVNGSRLLIFKQNMEPALIGDWKWKEGVAYSNLNHEKPSFNYGWKGYSTKKVTTTQKKSIYNYPCGSSYLDDYDYNPCQYNGYGYEEDEKFYYGELLLDASSHQFPRIRIKELVDYCQYTTNEVSIIETKEKGIFTVTLDEVFEGEKEFWLENIEEYNKDTNSNIKLLNFSAVEY